jgi:hypothetical protein
VLVWTVQQVTGMNEIRFTHKKQGSKTASLSRSHRQLEWKKKHIKKDFRAQRPIKFRLDHLALAASAHHKSAAIAAFSHAQNWSRGGTVLAHTD